MTDGITPLHSLDHIRQYVEVALGLGAVKKGHPYREMVLATAADSGSPDLRTVINRKVTKSPLSVRAYTDLRSAKVRHLNEDGRAALLFWDPRKRIQVKLHTRAVIHHGDPLAMEVWKELGSKGREAYQTVEAPGVPMETARGDASKIDSGIGADFFAVIECHAVQMEVLQLRREGHLRAAFDYRNGETNGSFIVP